MGNSGNEHHRHHQCSTAFSATNWTHPSFTSFGHSTRLLKAVRISNFLQATIVQYYWTLWQLTPSFDKAQSQEQNLTFRSSVGVMCSEATIFSCDLIVLGDFRRFHPQPISCEVESYSICCSVHSGESWVILELVRNFSKSWLPTAAHGGGAWA